MECQPHVPSALTLGKEHTVSIEHVAEWAQVLEKRYIPCWDSNQRVSQSLYGLRYPGSEKPDTFAVWSVI